jgi:hypothetical protein
MGKNIILSVILAISLSAAAFKGYQYFSIPAEKPKQQKENASPRTDLFALQELIAVLKPFHEAKTIDASFTTMLLGKDRKTDMGSFEGRYIKDAHNLYIKSIGSENILNKDYFVAIDHHEQMIFVEKPELQAQGGANFFRFGFLADLDSLVNLPDSVVFYARVNETTGKLTMAWRSAQYYKTELLYDLETKMLKEVWLYPYQDIFTEKEAGEISDQLQPSDAGTDTELPEIVSIKYHEIRLNQEVDAKWFNTAKYFRQEKSTITTTKNYQHYVIDFE